MNQLHSSTNLKQLMQMLHVCGRSGNQFSVGKTADDIKSIR